MDKVVAIYSAYDNKKLTFVCVGRWEFAITNDNNIVTDEHLQHFYKQNNKEQYNKYMDAFELALLAYENDMYDRSEDSFGKSL